MLKFRGREITRDRLGWWFRIALTRVFGRSVKVEGRDRAVRIFPWVHRGRLLLMGLEVDSLEPVFVTSYSARLRAAATVSCDEPPRPAGRPRQVVHVILCHQQPELVERIHRHHRNLGPGYRVAIAYGGPRERFDAIGIEDKFFVEDPSLRGPAHFMNHHEMLEKALQLPGIDRDSSILVFSEGDLVALAEEYLAPAIDAMVRHDAQFAAKHIRDITGSSNGFLARATARGIAGVTAGDPEVARRRYHHCLGCFFAIHGSMVSAMVDECRRMNGLYFEVQFPTAAAAAGARLLSLDPAYVEHIRYRPFFDADAAMAIRAAGGFMVHPLKEDQLVRLLGQPAGLAGATRNVAGASVPGGNP